MIQSFSSCGLSQGIPQLCIYGCGCRLYNHQSIIEVRHYYNKQALQARVEGRKGDRTNKHFLSPTRACNNAGKSSQTNYLVSTRNRIDDEVKLLMCTLISSCSFLGVSLTLPLRLCSSHQCTHIKSSFAEKAARRLETEHLLWVQVSVVTTDVC